MIILYGYNDRERSIQRNQIIIYLIMLINVLVYIYEVRLSGSTTISQPVLIHMGANYAPAIQAGQTWRLFTAMFLHLSLMHILSNMIALVCFANIARDIYNNFEFLVIYIVSGVVGNIVSLMFNPISISAGASTAIMGLLGCTLAMFALPKEDYNTQSVVQQAVFLLVINTVGVMGTNVDIAGHAGGALAGFVLGLIFIWIKRVRHTV